MAGACIHCGDAIELHTDDHIFDNGRDASDLGAPYQAVIGDFLRRMNDGPPYRDDAESLIDLLSDNGWAIVPGSRLSTFGERYSLLRQLEAERDKLRAVHALLLSWEYDEPGNGMLAMTALRRVLDEVER